ncbi:MAG: hypothetical protein Q8N48_00835 [Thiobacillus sp.]|nr:hypothetical protein [Thiobacillus sp.]MDP2977356.1 hypothetical protein [Thiobacillus sp.]
MAIRCAPEIEWPHFFENHGLSTRAHSARWHHSEKCGFARLDPVGDMFANADESKAFMVGGIGDDNERRLAA